MGPEDGSPQWGTRTKPQQEVRGTSSSEAGDLHLCTTTNTPQPFYGPFPGPPGWPGARRELLDFMLQGEINRGRHTDHPPWRHSIRTNQCLPPPSPHIFLRAGCPSCRPINSIKALKAFMQCTRKPNDVLATYYEMLHLWQRVCPNPNEPVVDPPPMKH